ncbi:immunoglobulin-like domain-containing protein [Listeria booriae]|uniref:immunoglobulin-like domain-containing protein n=1 Tax=Listeria booriae TaxID=1552123 RepID=UPI001E643F44|nr:immunoglobulin-like domain-containing protein [Listeria booriae]MCD2205461.1 Ig-like domain-containing protein [Listeria booriae]
MKRKDEEKMKTCLKVAVLLSSVLAIWWGIINQNPHQVAAQQKDINDPIIITQAFNPIEGIALPNAKIILTDYLGNTTSTTADKTGKFLLFSPVTHNGIIDIHQELNGLSGPKSTMKIFKAIIISRCSTTELVLSCIAANADIEIRTETGAILSQGKTGSDHYYTVDLTKVPDGTTLTSVLKSGGLEYHFSYTLPPVPSKFVVTETTEYKMRGIGVPNGYVRIQGDVVMWQNESDGSLYMDYWKHIPAGTKLHFIQSFNHREANPQEVLIGWSQKVNPVTAASTKLTGTGNPSTPTHVQTENGQVIGRGQADKDGNYTITIPMQPEGTKLRVFQTIAGTEYMSTITVEKNPYTLTASPYQIGNSNVTGTYTGTDLDQITKVVLLIDGVIVKNGVFNNTTKTFQISANGLVTNTNQRVEVALFHGNAELKRAPVTVTARPSATYTVTPATYQLGTSLVTGTYTGTDVSQITKVVLLVDGVVVKNGAFNNTTKAFQISAGGLVKNSKQRVEVALFNGTKELKRATVFVVDAYTLTTATYQIGSGYVTGSYSGLNTEAITKVVLLVNGVVVKNGALNVDTNTFRISAGGLVTNMRQQVEVALFIGTTEVKRTPVNVLGDFTLTPAAYQLGTNNITGSYAGNDLEAITKVVLLVDGVIVKNGTFDSATKTFQIYAKGLVTTATQRVEVALFNNTTELKRATVAVSSGESYTITATPYQLGSSYLTGAYTGTRLEAITKVSLLVNGVVVKNGTLAPTTKTFQIYANGFVTTANQRVEVALYVGSTQVARTSVPFR